MTNQKNNQLLEWKMVWPKILIFTFYLIIFWVSLYVLTCCYGFDIQSSVWLLLIILVPLVLLSFPFVEKLLGRIGKINIAGVEIILSALGSDLGVNTVEIDIENQNSYEKADINEFKSFIVKFNNTSTKAVFKLDLSRLDYYSIPMMYFQLMMSRYYNIADTILIIDSGKTNTNESILGTISIEIALKRIKGKYRSLNKSFSRVIGPNDQKEASYEKIDLYFRRFKGHLEEVQFFNTSDIENHRETIRELFNVGLERNIFSIPIHKSNLIQLFECISNDNTVIFIRKDEFFVLTAAELAKKISKSFLFNIGNIDFLSKD